MSIWRRVSPALPAGIYDEVVSEALEARLAELVRTHAVDLADVGKDADVDEQLVTLVRDAVRAGHPRGAALVLSPTNERRTRVRPLLLRAPLLT